ncbi:MAG: sigma-70 family RNA polymerase sigma factor [Woeseiaceae bacterium]
MTAPITQLLEAVRDGDRGSLDQLFALVYDELRGQAHRHLNRAGHARTLNTTALVHEAYLKLAACEQPDWQHRRHFFCVAARAMRQIIVDRARRHLAQKREGRLDRVDFDEKNVAVEEQADQLFALDAALAQLESMDARLVRVIELRFFAGLSVEDTARMLEVSERTIKRDWRVARAFLHRELNTG